MSKKLISILSIFLIFMLNCGTVYGEYDREKAAEYAQKYAKDGNSYFYEFGADCTNFVSQAEAVAGIGSYIPSKYPSAPNVFKKYVADSNENSWYMIFKERFIGFDYYVYSNHGRVLEILEIILVRVTLLDQIIELKLQIINCISGI